MGDSARDLLDFFDALPERAKYEVAVELLRRVLGDTLAAIPEECFVSVADELFVELDFLESVGASEGPT